MDDAAMVKMLKALAPELPKHGTDLPRKFTKGKVRLRNLEQNGWIVYDSAIGWKLTPSGKKAAKS